VNQYKRYVGKIAEVGSKDVPAALVEYDFVNSLFFFEEVLKRAVAKAGWLRGESVVDGPV
jgi:hypothetical protein